MDVSDTTKTDQAHSLVNNNRCPLFDDEPQTAQLNLTRKLSRALPISDASTTKNIEQFCLFRKIDVKESPNKPSLLSESVKKIMVNYVRVYFFESDTHRDYDETDLGGESTIADLIRFAVEDYCNTQLQFSPDCIDAETFCIKLADFNNQLDPVPDEIKPNYLVSDYIGSTVCLIRRTFRQSNAQKLQQKLKNSEVFSITIPFQKSMRLIDVPRDGIFANLMERVFKACDILQSPTDFQLVQYNRLAIYDKNTKIQNIASRDFELLRAKKQPFDDEGPLAGRSTTKQEPRRPPCFFTSQLNNLESSPQIITAVVSTSVLHSSLTLSLEDCCIVERFGKTFLSFFVDMICEPQYEKRYDLTTLVSAYTYDEYLVLIFLIKKQHIKRKYRIAEQERVAFLRQILRLCRIFKKTLTVPKSTFN